MPPRFEIEVRLVWKRRREDGPPLNCSRRVADEAEARERAKELGSDCFDIDVLTAAKQIPAANPSEAPAVEEDSPIPPAAPWWLDT